MPIFIEPPDALENAGYWLWIGLSGSNPNWGGCAVWLSSDGVSYENVGVAMGKATMGVLTAALAATADPDTADTLSVDLTQSSGVLTSFSQADCDSFRSLCWVDNELISYQSATLTAANKYNIGTRIRRGLYGTAIASHAIGAGFLFIDDSICRIELDPTWVGKTLYLKFTSFNPLGGGVQSLSDVSPYTYVFSGRYNNFLQIIGNDAIITTALDGAGGAKVSIFGAGGPGTGITLKKSDSGSRSAGPFADFTALALSSIYYALLNPATNTAYLLTDHNAASAAVYNGHVALGSAKTPDATGAGGFAAGGGGGFAGGDGGGGFGASIQAGMVGDVILVG